MEFTKEQQKVICASGDLLVTASAGCGKTTVMLERVLRLLKEKTPLSRMLISTFTNSAAADMRSKLNLLLRAEYESSRDPFIKQQYEYLPSADISTLHTWCLKTIRKYFFVTGDDPAFEIAGDAEASLWKREAIERVIEEYSVMPEMFDVFETYTARRRTGKIYSIVSDLMEFAAAQDDGDGWLEGAAGFYGSGEADAFLSQYEVELLQSLERRFNEFEMSAAGAGVWDKAAVYLDALRSHAGGGDEPYPVARGITAIKDEYDALKKAVKKLEQMREDRAQFRPDEARAAAEAFVSMAKAATVYYSEKKQEKGQLDFNDLERRAKEILLSPSGQEVRRSYDYIFIDEYQDINPLQESIIKLLKGDNTMFFVGDIKQSIYSFRNCSPHAFAEKSRELPPGAVLPLNSNFRCRPGILAFCNNVFSRVMTEDFGKVDYKTNAMFAINGDINDGSVELITVPDDEKEKKDEATFDEVYSVRAAAEKEPEKSYCGEAIAAASKILQLLQEKITENGVTRDVTYDDIVVIVRSRGGCVSDIEHVLRAAGVPVALSRDLKLTGGRYSRDLLSYLRLIDNRRDDISMLGAMRSVFGGFSDGELAEIRRRGPDGSFFAAVTAAAKNNDAAGKKVKDFLSVLDNFTAQSRVIKAGELAGRITAHFDYFKFVLGRREGAQHADAIAALLEKMNSFTGCLSEWLDYIDTVDPSGDPSASGGSVRIMTTHGSKGLEFPFVILCNLGRKFNMTDLKDGMCDSRFGLALTSRNRELRRKFGTDVLMAAKIRKEHANKEEELRILYVAMTRAKHRLVIMLPEGDGDKEPDAASVCRASDWLLPHAKAWGCKPYAPLPEAKSPPPPKALNQKTLDFIKSRVVDLNLPKPHIIKATVTRLAKDAESAEPRIKVLYENTGGADAVARGNAYHRALELYDYAKPIQQIDGLLESVPDAQLIDKEKLTNAVMFLSEKAAGRKVYREQPFLYKIDDMIVQGVIDMLIVSGGQCEIVDYKTGRLDESSMTVYRKQLAIYADAVEKTLGFKVTKSVVFSIDECAEKE